jgi:hypothetical protein
MNIPILLVKVTGAVLLAWTIRSIVKHFKGKRQQKDTEQSLSERLLNNLLLYLWLAFMLVFSIGMIVNN